MTTMTLRDSGAQMLRRDWLASLALHGALWGGALWLIAAPTPQSRPLDVVLRWAAPEPVRPVPPQVEAPPIAPPPMQAPRVRPVEPQRRKVQAARDASQASVEAHEPAPLLSAPDVALPAVSAAPPVKAPPEAAAPAQPPPAPVDDQAYQQWRARLEHALQQGKRYPTGARRMGQTGTVVVHLRIAADGSLLHCMLHHSSGFKVLDQAAEQLVRSVAQSLGAQVPPGRAADLRIPIVYELTES